MKIWKLFERLQGGDSGLLLKSTFAPEGHIQPIKIHDLPGSLLLCGPLSPSSILTILPNFSPFSPRNSFLLVFLTQHFPVYFLFLVCLFQYDLHALLEF